jgi:uncharacterized repeat protein (TIGR01451 family)
VCRNADGSDSCTASASVSTGRYQSLRKTANGSGPFSSGDTVSYDIALDNAGSLAVLHAAVEDVLPAGLSNGTWTCKAPAGSPAACPAPSGNMPLGQTGFTLPAHGRLIYTVSATVDAVSALAPVTRTNTATSSVVSPGTGKCWDGSAASNLPCTASASIDVAAGYLSLSKTASPATAQPGDTVTYTITLSNAGSTAVTGASVNDALPAGLINGAWSCVGNGAACPAGAGVMPLAATGIGLPAGGSLIYTVSATVDATTPPGALPNTQATATSTAAGVACWSGSAASALPCTASAASNVVVDTGYLMSVSKTASSAAAKPGDAVSYTITLRNESTGLLTGVTVADTLPTGLINGTWTCTGTGASCPAGASGSMPLPTTGTSLPVNSTLVYEVSATVAPTTVPGTTLSNTATADAGNGKCWNGFSASTTSTCTASADVDVETGYLISLSKTPIASPVAPGDTVTYTVTLSNAGATEVTGASVTDALPAGLIHGAWTCSGGASCPAGSVSGNLNHSNITLPVNTSLVYTVTATVAPTASGTLTNTQATATMAAAGALACWSGQASSAPPCKASAASATVVATGYLMSLSKTVSGTGPFFPGDTVKYDITLKNESSGAITGITVQDSLPAGLIHGTWTCAACPASGSMPLNHSGITLPANASLVYTVTATVGAVSAPGTLANTNATATTTAAGAACWSGSAKTGPTCTASAAVTVLLAPLAASAVPMLGPWGYGLMGLGVWALAAAATARRRRAAAN